MPKPKKVNIFEMSFKELVVLFSEYPETTINCGALLKTLERFEEHMVTTYDLKATKVINLNKK